MKPRARRDLLDADHNAMMAWATVLYSAEPGALGPQDLRRNRGQVGEALVGEWIEAGRPPVRFDDALRRVGPGKHVVPVRRL